MQMQIVPQVITLSEYAKKENSEEAARQPGGDAARPPAARNGDFLETLFRFLGDKRRYVISFIRMKLDRERRTDFIRALTECRNLHDEIRCVKRFAGHLKVNDFGALMNSLPALLPGKIEALTYHGEVLPENRLAKFAKTFGFTESDAIGCMLWHLFSGPASA